MNPAKKIGLFLVALLLVVSPLVSPGHVFAQNEMQGRSAVRSRLIPTQKEFEAIIKENNLGENPQWTLESHGMAKIYSDFGSLGMGMMGSTDGSDFAGTGLVPQIGNAMAAMISYPPAGVEEYLADALYNSPLVPPAYAQGVGFKSLTPILPIWKTFRDLAYICFIFVFAGIGFAIMFRKKLGGQAVATISNAIPRLVVTLILITFSYAIAGLMIDLMYIIIYFISSVFTNLIEKPAAELVAIALSNNILENGFNVIFQDWRLLDNNAETNSVAGAAAQSIGQIVQGFFGNSGLSGAVGNILGVGANVVGFLIIALAIMFAVVKTFFELLKSYVTFIIMVIFSPFQLLLGAFKENGDVVQWLRNLAATLAPFPVVITMIFLAMTLGGYGKDGVGFGGGNVAGGFQPPQLRLPFVPNPTGGIAAVQGLIVIGLLMLIPEAVEMSKKALKATDPMGGMMKDVMKNLKSGWEGGQLVPGFGPKIPGASQLLPGMAKMGGSAAGGAVLGGLGGTIGGAAAGVNLADRQGGGTARKLLYGLAGGGLGGVGGTVVGTTVGAGLPVMTEVGKRVGPKIQQGAEFVGKADKVVEVVKDLSRRRTAEETVKKASVPAALPPVPVRPDQRPADTFVPTENDQG